MRLWEGRGLGLCAVLAWTHAFVSAATPPVSARLRASWSQPSLLVQILETIALERPDRFWPAVDVVERITIGTPAATYSSAFQVFKDAGVLDDERDIAAVQLSLAARETSPTVQAFYSLDHRFIDDWAFNSTGSTEIRVDPEELRKAKDENWLELNGVRLGERGLKTTIAFQLLLQSGEKIKLPRPGQDQSDVGPLLPACPTRIYPFDHVRGQHGPLAIFNVDIEWPKFGSVHKQLSKLAREGRLRYVLRWRPPESQESSAPSYLSGFGTGLDIKKADYLAIDDRQIQDHPSGDDPTAASSSSVDLGADDDAPADLVALTTGELRDIGVRASQFVLSSSDPLAGLTKLSQDFPRYASTLVKKWQPGPLSESLLAELNANQAQLVPGGANMLWINGLNIPERDVNTYKLLRTLRDERKRIRSLVKAGLTDAQAADVLSHPATSTAGAGQQPADGSITLESLGHIFDASDRAEDGNAIFWWNDVETDRRYRQMSESVKALLRPTYPGQLPAIRRNLFNIVLALDLTKTSSLIILSTTVQQFIQQGLPIRFGLVPIEENGADEPTESAVISAVIDHVARVWGKVDAMMMIKQFSTYPRATVSSADLRSLYEAYAGAKRSEGGLKDGSDPLEWDAVLQAELNGPRAIARRAYAQRLGLGLSPETFGHAFVNGKHSIVDDDIRRAVQDGIGPALQYLQQAVYEGQLEDTSDVANFFYDLPTAFKRRNALLFGSSTASALNVVNLAEVLDLEAAPYLRRGFFGSQSDNVTLSIYVLVDLTSHEHREGIAQPALDFIVRALTMLPSRTKVDHPQARLCLLDTAAGDASLRLIAAARTGSLDASSVLQLLSDDVSTATGEDRAQLAQVREQTQKLAEAAGIAPGHAAVIVNGRVISPIAPGALSAADYSLLADIETKDRLAPALQALRDARVDVDGLAGSVLTHRLPDAHSDQRSVLISHVSSALASAQIVDPSASIFQTVNVARMNAFEGLAGTHSSFTVGDKDSSLFRLTAIIDPVSETAQKWAHILAALSKSHGVWIRVYLNPVPYLKELPIKRFYRHTFASALEFEDDGSVKTPDTVFNGLPEGALLTLAMDTPPSWVAFPSRSVHDLDNIRLSDLSGAARLRGIDAEFSLENIIVEGHARDMPSGQPPRGLQLVLSGANGHKTDSLVMANLGYFQLKANPGVFQLSIRPGRSSEVFNISSIGNDGLNSRPVNETGSEVFLTTFDVTTIYPQFTRNPGYETEELLALEGKAVERKSTGGSLFSRDAVIPPKAQQVLSTESTALQTQRTGKTINIFTVASGLLYERMAFIMMLSVLRHTANPCKFWLIANFLSPSFKSLIPHMAEAYGFEYELVTYVWPHWLRSQKEKQRTIWGYKILFLDVLFPLELDRVIFVDSDQIVRTDMKQLIDLDLKGAPYAFTPMGDSRTEMEGYRFWKTGYWKDHLAGLPYHISALYVVDLDRFRAIAAGDRLRASYQALSADPGSLANLDQDLPNNLQREIPIFSLDKTWLFCETWCASEELAQAKTIDLCNNPETHEPKLARAKRLIPEWTTYDEEVAAVARNATKAAAAEQQAQAFAADASALLQARQQQVEFVEEGTGATSATAQSTPAAGHLKGEL